MDLSRRQWLAASAVAGVPALLANSAFAADEAPPAKVELPPGALNEEQLGTLLESIGLKPVKNKARYDFQFADTPDQEKEEWTYSMSVVLSGDQKTIWVLAWLDELPKSSKDVPRLALLKMLAENDKMGKGQFFSYISTNKRFALQQVIENRELTTKKFRTTLRELGQTVYHTYPIWSVDAWTETPGTVADTTPIEAPVSQNASENAKEAGPTRGTAAKPAGTTPARNVSNTRTKPAE